MTFDDYMTVSKFADEIRANGGKCDHGWFTAEIAAGRIPSINIAGRLAVRRCHLEEAMPRYREEVARKRTELGRAQAEKNAAERTRLEELTRLIHKMDRDIDQIRHRFDLLLLRMNRNEAHKP